MSRKIATRLQSRPALTPLLHSPAASRKIQIRFECSGNVSEKEHQAEREAEREREGETRSTPDTRAANSARS